MSVKTLATYLDKLNTTRQDYIVMCVRSYSGRPDFHRGLLPFLSCQEAADCLKFQLEHVKSSGDFADPEATSRALKRERFIRQTISIFGHALLTRVAENEDYQVIHLNSKKMMKHFRRRYDKKFVINLREFGYYTGKPGDINTMYELQMVSRNQWKITGDEASLPIITQVLADIFSLT